MQIAQAVLPTINQWHSQGPPQLLQPRLVPCNPVINSSGITTAVSQPQTPAVQPPQLPPAISGNAVSSPLGKIGLSQSNFTPVAAEPTVP